MLAQPVARSEPRDGAIVSKAAIRAAERLGVSQRDLGTIIGVSESTVSRMKTGDFPLDRDPKAFELSLLFIPLLTPSSGEMLRRRHPGSRATTPLLRHAPLRPFRQSPDF